MCANSTYNELDAGLMLVSSTSLDQSENGEQCPSNLAYFVFYKNLGTRRGV